MDTHLVNSLPVAIFPAFFDGKRIIEVPGSQRINCEYSLCPEVDSLVYLLLGYLILSTLIDSFNKLLQSCLNRLFVVFFILHAIVDEQCSSFSFNLTKCPKLRENLATWKLVSFSPFCELCQEVFFINFLQILLTDVRKLNIEGGDSFVNGHKIKIVLISIVLNFTHNFPSFIISLPRQYCHYLTFYFIVMVSHTSIFVILFSFLIL